MTRNSLTALLAAFLVVGSAFGQAPLTLPAPTLGNPVPMPPAPAPGGMTMQPGTPDGGPAEDDGNEWWVSLDYLLATVRGELLPPLVTTSPAGTARAAAGVLGQPGTQILFGGRPSNTQARSGVQGNGGYWFDADQELGIESGFLFLGGARNNFSSSSDGSQILARPFIDAAAGAQASVLSGFPGAAAGSISVSDVAQQLYTGTIDLRANVVTKSWLRIDSLLGYRYLQYEDRLQIQQTINPIGGAFVPGTSVQTTDSFHARNVFNGVDVGLRAELVYEDFSLGLLARVAGGYMTRQGDISGSQVTTVPGTPAVTSANGLLAQPSNTGSNHPNTWTGVPELGATFGYQVTSSLRLRIGYAALGVSRILRASDQIDPRVNLNQATPPAVGSRPTTTTQASNFWMDALTIGAEFRY